MASPKKFTGSLITNLAKSLIAGQGDPRIVAAKNAGINPILAEQGDDTIFAGYDWDEKVPTQAQMLAVENDASNIANLQDISNGVSMSQLAKLAAQSARLHPFKTAGLVGLGAGNIGGLMDNNKFGGQLGGLALGGLGSYLAGANPYTAAMLTMGGGELGALFDKLRAKREQPQQPLYGGR